MHNRLIIFVIVLFAYYTLGAQGFARGHEVLSIWPNGPPGIQSGPDTERDITGATDGLTAGEPVIRLSNVSRPTLTLYSPKERNIGAAVVVFPGGGYKLLAFDLEGSEVCDWLSASGITCLVLKYRVPNSGPFPVSSVALQDAQRALGVVRFHAADWRIDPNRVGVLGFSAGGHLAAVLSNIFDGRLYPPIDAADKLSCRPNFAVLIYPAYLSTGTNRSPLADSIHVTNETPPTFLLGAEDDQVAPVEGMVAYFLALKNAKVPAEMHIYAEGGHGFGLRPTGLPLTAWPRYVEYWLHTIKIVP
jgi:acetyl esterase/lipase